MKGGLILFHFHHIMRVFLLHQVARGVALRMECIGGDDGPRDIEQLRDFIGFDIHVDWADHLPSAMH